MRSTPEIALLSLFLAATLLLSQGAVLAQPPLATAPTLEQFTLVSSDTLFRLSKTLILPNSETVYLDSTKLTPGKNYVLDPSAGTLRVSFEGKDSAKGKSTIYIYYNYLPFSFQSEYRHQTLSVRRDTTSKRMTVLSARAGSSPFSNIFGPDLQKSGSIFRGFSVGSNRDLTLNSGFRLQFAGKLSSDVEILAALTDENTPIQPEGNTQTLQELDKVFVEIKSSEYEATLGDFYLDMSSGEFGRLSRKLQGAQGNAGYSSPPFAVSATIVGASARGKFTTAHFSGIEGVQGPYLLYGKNSERNIIIIAGTERVYVDGELMTRGETNDYAIDYAGSQITFSSKRLITSYSRIVVDYQYTDRSYTRNFFAVQSSSRTTSDAVKLSILYAREGDDPSAPIDISLTDNDKSILAASGSRGAKKSGVDSVGVDSSGIGRGSYAAVDTLIQGAIFRIYRYAAGEREAQFNVTFSFVGVSQGDYVRESLGHFRFVGTRNGQYLPIIILPSPQLQQLADINTSLHLMKDLSLEGEYAASNVDPNRFSTGNEKSGGAMKFSARYNPSNIRFAGVNIGSFDLSASDRHVNRDFSPIDRIDDVEFARKWSLDSTVTIQSSSEEIREGRLAYTPLRTISLGGGLGSNTRGAQFSANRYDAFFRLAGEGLPNAEYTAEEIATSAGASSGSNDWFRQRASLAYTFARLTPSVRFEDEKRTIETGTSDSLNSSSFSFASVAPRIAVKDLYGMSLSGGFELRNDKGTIDGILQPQSRSLTQTYGWSLPETNNFSSSLDVVFRQKSFKEKYRLTNGDIQTILIRSQSRYAPFQRGVDADAYYEVATERSAKLERVFYKVQRGEGQYVWTDGNGNGRVDLTDERDFQLSRFDGDYIVITVPSDELYPVIDLKTSGRLRFTPNKFLTSRQTWTEKALGVLSTESYVRLEEKSSEADTRKIYLLDLGHLLQPATTILGSQLLQQDLFLFENRSDYSFRFRFQQRRGLGQYSSGLEQSYSRERSIRIRVQLVTEISNQIDYANKQDNLAAAVSSGRSRAVASDDLTSDYSYRPEQNIEVGFRVEVSRSDDDFPRSPVAANLNSQSLRTVFSFQGSGQARVDFSREEVILENPPPGFLIPFELTGGRSEGKTYLWGVSFDYRISGNLQSSLQYTGRSEQYHAPIHTARAEVRAFF